MLIKRTELMASNVKSVKKSGIKLAAIALVAATAYAPTTMASEPLLIDREITAKFSSQELKAENGTSAVYAELMKKSKRVCRSDRNTLKYTGETVEECVADLMDQFIESADIESLKKYHLTAVQTKSYAMTQG
jgi:UrcA family protein